MGLRLGKEICSGQGQGEYGLCESGAKTTENAGGPVTTNILAAL